MTSILLTELCTNKSKNLPTLHQFNYSMAFAINYIICFVFNLRKSHFFGHFFMQSHFVSTLMFVSPFNEACNSPAPVIWVNSDHRADFEACSLWLPLHFPRMPQILYCSVGFLAGGAA